MLLNLFRHSAEKYSTAPVNGSESSNSTCRSGLSSESAERYQCPEKGYLQPVSAGSQPGHIYDDAGLKPQTLTKQCSSSKHYAYQDVCAPKTESGVHPEHVLPWFDLLKARPNGQVIGSSSTLPTSMRQFQRKSSLPDNVRFPPSLMSSTASVNLRASSTLAATAAEEQSAKPVCKPGCHQRSQSTAGVAVSRSVSDCFDVLATPLASHAPPRKCGSTKEVIKHQASRESEYENPEAANSVKRDSLKHTQALIKNFHRLSQLHLQRKSDCGSPALQGGHLPEHVYDSPVNDDFTSDSLVRRSSSLGDFPTNESSFLQEVLDSVRGRVSVESGMF